MRERLRQGRVRRFDSVLDPTPVQAVTIEASVKELLVQLLQTMRSGQTQRHRLGEAAVTARFVRSGGSKRRERGWVLSVQQPGDAEPDEIDVGHAPSKQEIGWIDQRDGWFIVVGAKVSVVTRLVKALGMDPHQTLVTRVG